jgi:hypothetical protein
MLSASRGPFAVRYFERVIQRTSQGSMTTEAVATQYTHLRARRLMRLVHCAVPCRSSFAGAFTAYHPLSFIGRHIEDDAAVPIAFPFG